MLNDNDKKFCDMLNEARRYVKSELELDCVDGKWYAMDYIEDFECAFPMEAKPYNKPIITDEEAEEKGIDIIKCCDECNIAYVG